MTTTWKNRHWPLDGLRFMDYLNLMTTTNTNTNNGLLAAGTVVKTIQGDIGTVVYHRADGWYGVHIEGETTVTGGLRVDEWPRSALIPAVSRVVTPGICL